MSSGFSLLIKSPTTLTFVTMNWLLCSCSPTEVHKKSALLDELILLMKRNTHFVTLTLKLKWQKIKPRFTAQTLGNFSLSSIYTLPNHRYFTGLKSKLSRMFAPISWNTPFLLLSFQILTPPPWISGFKFTKIISWTKICLHLKSGMSSI